MAVTLKAARVNKGLNQQQASSAIGVSVETLSNWENGRTSPTVQDVQKIESLYGLPYADIIFPPCV